MATTEFHIHASVSPADLDAALRHIQKRARRHSNPAEGVCAALFACVFVTAEGLVRCGLPADQVKRILDQQTAQVMFQIEAENVQFQADAGKEGRA